LKLGGDVVRAQAGVVAVALAGGSVRIYAGLRPEWPEQPPAQATLIAEVRLPDPAFEAMDGSLSARPIEAGKAVAKGRPTFFRCVSREGVVILDGSIGPGKEMVLTASAVEVGAIVRIKGLTYGVSRGE